MKGSQFCSVVLPISNWPTLDEKGFKKFKLFLVSVITLCFCENETIDLNYFIDFANVWEVDYNSSLDSNKIRSSTGIAANWLSPLGPITFTLSQNLLKADTDETESFNFNLGTTF